MRRYSIVLTLVTVVLLAACSKDPEVAKREYLASGDRYTAEKKYSEAIIEYRNAIAQDARFGEARFKLAEVLRATDEPEAAYREYVRAADLLPKDVKAQVQAGRALLGAKQYPEARDRASAALALDPKNIEALTLMGNALAGLKDFDGAVIRLQEAIDNNPQETLTYENLGILQLKKGDTQAAENVFKRAVELAPNSASAHWALGNYYWAAKKTTEAEAEFKKSYAIDPKSPVLLRGMATFYLMDARTTEAEKYLQQYADVSTDIAPKLILADFHVRRNRSKEARAVLESLAKSKDGFVPAQTRLSFLDYGDGQHDEAYRKIDAALKQDPKNEAASLMKVRFLILDRKYQDALTLANGVVERNPKSALGLLLKAAVHRGLGQLDEAIKTYQAVLADNPSTLSAQVELGKLYVARGNWAGAKDLASQALKTEPRLADAHLIMAKVALSEGDDAKAATELAILDPAKQNSAEVYHLLGNVYWKQRNVAKARDSYAKALAIDPNFIPALSGAVNSDLADKKPDAARAAIETRLQKTPDNASLLALAGRTYVSLGDHQRAEAALKKALEKDPASMEAYITLGGLYKAQNRLEEARHEFEELAKRRPEQAVSAKTFVGIILNLQNKSAEARKAYEEALQLDSRAAIAANNLAWDYSENGGNLDMALQLAQTAKSRLPDSASVNDTLGWVYYKKDLAPLAVSTLRQAIEQSPSSPTIHYHLGMALLKSGDKGAAKKSLQRALELNPKFNGAEDAKKALGTING